MRDSPAVMFTFSFTPGGGARKELILVRNGDGKGEGGVKERGEVKLSPVSVCRSVCLVGLLRYFKVVVPSLYILLYYSLLSPKGEEVKAEKRKTADARTREE